MALTESEVDISASLDERAGFFTHYILNVSWCPTTCMYLRVPYLISAPIDYLPNSSLPYTVGTEQVLHYVVTRNPGRGGCGKEVTVTADAVSYMPVQWT